MINIKEELRQIYVNDNIPASKEVTYKRLKVYFPGIRLEVPKENVVSESFELIESICSDSDLIFGGCESAQVKFTLAGIEADLEGMECIITQVVDERFEMPLGTYVVDSVKRQNDRHFRDVTGYDHIYDKLDTDVTAWYKSLALPMPLKLFRQSLFSYVGISLEEQTLINDDMVIERTIEPSALNGRTVAKAIGEITGTFGHMTRNNTFKYITLSGFGLYPAEDLYPSEDLFPSEPAEQLGRAGYISTVYEDYMVSPIDCLQIRQEDGDVGCVVFDSRNHANPYIVTGNFLVYGKSAADLEIIAEALYNEIKEKTYRPHTTIIPGLPYLEVGDAVSIVKASDTIETFIFSRKLAGIQSLRDEISATGNQYRNNEVSPNDEIEMLKGKSMVIQKSVDGLSVTVSDLEEHTNSQFEITSKAISAEVQRASKAEGELSGKIDVTAEGIKIEAKRAQEAEGELSGSIDVMAGSIEMKVSKGDVSSEISLEPDTVYLRGNRVVIESDQFTLDGRGNAYFGGELESGTRITAPEIVGGTITGCRFVATGNGETTPMVTVDNGGSRSANLSYAALMFDGGSGGFIRDYGGRGMAVYCGSGGSSGIQATRGMFDEIATADGSYITMSPKVVFEKSGSYRNAGINCYGIWGDSAYFDSWCYAPSWDSGSDRRLKMDINYETQEDFCKLIKSLKPVSYRLKSDDTGKLRFGFIAQDIQEEVNKLYPGEKPLYKEMEDEEPFLTLSYDDIIAPLVAMVQQQQHEIEELRRIIIEGSGKNG